MSRSRCRGVDVAEPIPRTTLLLALIALVNLHGLVNPHRRVVQRNRNWLARRRRWRWRGGICRGGRKSARRSGDRVRVTVAAGARHGKRTTGDKQIERSVAAILRVVGALGLRDRQQVHLHAGQRDLLRYGRAGRWRCLLEKVIVDAQRNHRYDESGYE